MTDHAKRALLHYLREYIQDELGPGEAAEVTAQAVVDDLADAYGPDGTE